VHGGGLDHRAAQAGDRGLRSRQRGHMEGAFQFQQHPL
jgi:hypothetical protein